MRYHIPRAVVVLAVWPAAAAGQGFEGRVHAQMLVDGKPVEILYYVKDVKTRTETTSPEIQQQYRGPAISIWDGTTGEMITVMPAQKMYTRMKVKDLAKGLESQDRERHLPDLQFQRTGRKETIAGHECEHWLVGKDHVDDLCLAPGLGFWGASGQGGPGALRAMGFDRRDIEAQLTRYPELRDLAEHGAFPLKVENKSAKFTMVVTDIQRTRLDDDLFRPPAGYQEMNLGKAMQQLIKGNRPKP
jgi:hypothetical protein